jgi:hypothetical protein
MKAWKVTQLVGVLLLLFGVIVRAGAGEFWGTGVAVFGVLVFAVGRVAGWLRSDQP